ncbi:MAG: restriction endonuclease subunit S [Winogradskyella sp.]
MEEVLLSSICDLKNGFAFKSKDYVDSSNTLSCRMSSIRPGGNFDLEHNQRFLPDTYAEVYSDYLLNDGDIVIAMTDLAGDPKILGVPTIVNTGGKKLLQNQRVGKLEITDSSKVFIPYLQYALNRPSNKSYYKKFAGGGLQINVSKKDILNITIPLPPLDQQKKIAAILDAADAYRQKTKALITKYDALTQSLFLDMFGDPVRNPMGWEKESLYLCLQKVEKIGKDYSGENIEYVDIGSVDNIRNIITETTTYKIQERPSRAQQILLSGDIIISTVRPNLKNIALNQVDGRIGSTGFFVCRAVLNKLSNLFLFKVMLTDSVTDYFVGITSGANYPAVKSNDLKKFQVIVPPIDLQNQFAERIQAIEAQKTQSQASLAQAEDLFNSLLQRAFKGELV